MPTANSVGASKTEGPDTAGLDAKPCATRGATYFSYVCDDALHDILCDTLPPLPTPQHAYHDLAAVTAIQDGDETQINSDSSIAHPSIDDMMKRVNTVDTNGLNGSAKHTNGVTIQSPLPIRSPISPAASDTSSSSGDRPRHKRKQSNPLAPPFIVSAPGKTIVYGEHSVVHGKAAIAAAISLRSYLLCTTLTKSKRTVTLRFPDIGLDHTWNIPELPWKDFAHPSKKKKYYDLVTSLDDELVDTLKSHTAAVSPDASAEKRKLHQNAATMFLYLYLSLGSESSPPCIYTLRSTIPIGAGLGSSASISVCVSTALLVQCRALSGPHPDQMAKEAEEQLERINRWAFVGEMLIHGNPSGIDNTVATNGRAVLFQRKDYTKPPSVEILRDFPELPLMLVDTCQPKSTATEVAKVGLLKKTYPVVAENIFNAIDSIVRSVYESVTREDFDTGSTESIKHLGELMDINHGLLTSLGVSHPKLERLRYLVDQAGVGWTKLTGAGGGGCAITLLKPPSPDEASKAPDSSSAALRDLQQNLQEEGFEIFDTTLGGDGVGVLYPAVINHEEIDQDMFLTAQGGDGVEELVGGKYDRTAWKYWRP
ncbi:Hypothetical protein R9X50_00662600 [Acrodontium crateriforme]|uniref:Mevalonate kinase n=1 Tax=Acrodontium crateriforme TaxID=150365 RepID=A0AAQ3MBA3_9PEZI|nr:Hypothetical protein R9X50_00662600 [Acrodontium crateriforme]